MSDALTVRAHERGVTRVFAVNLPKDEIPRFRADEGAAIAAALGVEKLDMDHVELFPVSDLGPLSLSDYLIAGAGLPKDAILAQRGELDALTGHVLILHSRAFMGRAADVVPHPPLTWVATHALPSVTVPMEPLRSEGARGTLGGAVQAASGESGLPAWSFWLLGAVLVLILIGVLALL